MKGRNNGAALESKNSKPIHCSGASSVSRNKISATAAELASDSTILVLRVAVGDNR
jgi:hypothetical protein